MFKTVQNSIGKFMMRKKLEPTREDFSKNSPSESFNCKVTVHSTSVRRTFIRGMLKTVQNSEGKFLMRKKLGTDRRRLLVEQSQ